MKKIAIALLFITHFATAQITLEHTYSQTTNLYHVSPNEWDYVNLQGNTANIYSITHALIVSIPLNVPVGNTAVNIWSVSVNLFSTDGKYDVGYGSQNPIASFSPAHASVINQDGTSLLEVDSAYSGAIFNTPQGTKAIFDNNLNANTAVYSLPGTYYSIVSAVSNKKSKSKGLFNAYPNPSSEYVTLPYNLQPGEKAKMIITNALGQVIQQYKIDNTFSSILFDVSKIPAGEYFYYIDDNGSKTEALKFVKS